MIIKTFDLIKAARALPESYIRAGLDVAAFYWTARGAEVIIATCPDLHPLVWTNDQWSNIGPHELPPRYK